MTKSTYEPPHDKTNKMTCAPSENSDQPGHPLSLIRIITVCMKKAKTLIRLGGCPGWSESSPYAQTFCWFCHEAAHIFCYKISEHRQLNVQHYKFRDLVGWLCWGLTSQSTIFQSYRDGAIASWVINQYFRGVKCLAQGHNTAAVGLEPRTSRSGVRHSTTEPPRSPTNLGICDGCTHYQMELSSVSFLRHCKGILKIKWQSFNYLSVIVVYW